MPRTAISSRPTSCRSSRPKACSRHRVPAASRGAAFRGSYAEFRHTIRHELVHVFQLSFASQTFGANPRFRQTGMPLWWTEGLAEFFSAGETAARDGVARHDDRRTSADAARLDLRLRRIGVSVGAASITPAERYGEWRISSCTTISGNIELRRALAGVYGRTLSSSPTNAILDAQHYYPAVASQPRWRSRRASSPTPIKPTPISSPEIPSHHFSSSRRRAATRRSTRRTLPRGAGTRGGGPAGRGAGRAQRAVRILPLL